MSVTPLQVDPRSRSRLRRLAVPVGAAGAVLAATAAVHVRDPHVGGSWGFCPIRLTTGLDCPGCGGLRAVHHLTDFEIGAALSSNLVIVLAIPFVVALWAVWIVRAWRGSGGRAWPSERTRMWTGVAVAGLLIGFGIVRNLPFAPWLAS